MVPRICTGITKSELLTKHTKLCNFSVWMAWLHLPKCSGGRKAVGVLPKTEPLWSSRTCGLNKLHHIHIPVVKLISPCSEPIKVLILYNLLFHTYILHFLHLSAITCHTNDCFLGLHKPKLAPLIVV